MNVITERERNRTLEQEYSAGNFSKSIVNNKKERIEWIDFCKGIAIICVVLGHSITKMGDSRIERIINLCIYSFHMPLFFMISGFNLNVKKNFELFIKSKIKNILLPAYLLGFILYVYKIVWYTFEENRGKLDELLNVRNFAKTLFWTRGSCINELWFLPCLFVALVIAYWILNFHNKIIQLILSLFCFLLGDLWGKYIYMPSPLYADVALCGVIFIVGGNIFIKKLIELDSKKTLQLILITFICFSMGNALQLYFKFGKVNFSSIQMGNIITFFLNAINGSMLVIGVSKICEKNRVINYIGKNTLVIYGVHYIFLKISCYIHEMYGMNNGIINSIMCTVVIMIFSLCIVKIVEKIENGLGRFNL